MLDTKSQRLRRARQTRIRIQQQDAIRLTVHRTNSHIYAQITTARGAMRISRRTSCTA